MVKYSTDSPARIGALVAVSVDGAGESVGATGCVGDGPGVGVVGARVGGGMVAVGSMTGWPGTGVIVGVFAVVGVTLG